MSENEQGREETVPLHVSASAVHKAVRNILNNEMKLNAELIRSDLLEQAKKHTYEHVDKYLKGTNYDRDGLDARVRTYLDTWFKRDFEEVVERIVREVAENRVNELVTEAVTVVITDMIKVRIGWNRKSVPVNVEMDKKDVV